MWPAECPVLVEEFVVLVSEVEAEGLLDRLTRDLNQSPHRPAMHLLILQVGQVTGRAM